MFTGTTLTENDADEKQMEEIIYESMEPAPLRSEVELALNHLSNGKSPGIDNILIEMWKASGKRRNYIVMEIIQNGIGNEEMATRLVRGNLCSSSKKGDKGNGYKIGAGQSLFLFQKRR